ncbi:MAG: hypothetical protein J5858_08135 [Lentisphaeria bacterium]|nr:hypothetical protein [Lentisphaeria bacterium]
MKTHGFLKKSPFISFRRICILSFIAAVPYISYAQNGADSKTANADLLEKHIQAKGSNTIVLNSSNIKLYWVDKSVLPQDGNIQIQLTKGKKNFESVPFKIQLANVTAVQDCEVEVITEDNDVNFQVSNIKNAIISKDVSTGTLGNYKSIVSKIHMEDASNLAFFLNFSSANEGPVAIKSVILSFSKNPDYLYSPGKFQYDKDSLLLNGGVFSSSEGPLFSVTGERNYCNSKKRFILREEPLTSSVTVKNTGEQASKVQFGYTVYMQNAAPLSGNLFPYKTPGSILKVVSSEKNSPQIVVDAYAEYQKGGFLALNAKDDFSDVPNKNFANGTIVEITKNDDGSAVITMSEPQKVALEKGMAVRVHGNGTGSNIYFYSKVLLPGEEEHIEFTINKDEEALRLSSRALPRGTYYVVPLITLYSEEKGKECTIQISDYYISY